MKVICILQARMDSKRLPGKVVADICGQPMLVHIINRLKRTKTIEEIIVATTIKPEDDVIVNTVKRYDIPVFRGDVDDVLGRIARVVEKWKPEIVVHATGDNPLVSPEVIDALVQHCVNGGYDFAFMSGLPLGVGADVYKSNTILLLDQRATSVHHREHINAYVFDNRADFLISKLLPHPIMQKPQLRLTVDTPEDLHLIKEIYKRLYKEGAIVNLEDVLKWYENEPKLFRINAGIEQLYISETAKKMREAVGHAKSTCSIQS